MPNSKPKPISGHGIYAKVTEQTSLPLHERLENKKQEKAQLAKDKVLSKYAKSKSKKANTPNPDSQKGPHPASGANSTKPHPLKLAAPIPQPKKREGLRGIEYSYRPDRPPMKVVRRPAEECKILHSYKVPPVPRLAGQEYIPSSDSEGEYAQVSPPEEESEDVEGEIDDNEDISEEDVDGMRAGQSSNADSTEAAKDDDQRSQASTALEEASDAEDFAIEFGVPSDRSPPAPKKITIANRQLVAQPARNEQDSGHSRSSTLLQPGWAGSHIAGQDLEFSRSAQPKEHPFGPQQLAEPALGSYTPEDTVLWKSAFPETPLPFDQCYNPLDDPGTTFGFDFQWPNNTLGLVDHPSSGDGVGPYVPETAPYGIPDAAVSNQGFRPHPQSFLGQLRGNFVPELESQPQMPGINPPSGDRSFVNQHSTAPPFETPIVSGSDTLPGSHAGPPSLRVPVLTRQQTPISTPARSFSRSVSGSLQTPLHKTSWPLQSTTRPSTPANQTHSPCSLPLPESPYPNPTPLTPTHSTPTPPHLAADDVGGLESVDDADLAFPVNNSGVEENSALRSHRRMRSDAHAPGVQVAEGSLAITESRLLRHTKRRRLMPTVNIPLAPTDEEIEKIITSELNVVQAGKKSNPRKANTGDSKPPPKGSFARHEQGYMAVCKASIMWDIIMRSPWSESIGLLVDRSVTRAVGATGMEEKDATEGFKKLVSSGVSSARTDLSKLGAPLVTRIIQGNSAPVQHQIDEDRFLYRGGSNNPTDFFKSPEAIDMTAELYFNSKRGNLGGIFIRELLQEEDPELRRSLFTWTSVKPVGEANASYDYADMSDDALRGPSVAAMAFAGIALLHNLKRLAGRTESFSESYFGEHWARYVRALVAHPDLGLIRATILEKIKRKYCTVYDKHRVPNSTGPCAWEWRDDLDI